MQWGKPYRSTLHGAAGTRRRRAASASASRLRPMSVPARDIARRRLAEAEDAAAAGDGPPAKRRPETRSDASDTAGIRCCSCLR